MSVPATIDRRRARRLALARAGLLRPEMTGLPRRAGGRGARARRAAHRVIDRFGYLQLDSVAIAGARTHSIVLASRLEGLDAALGETLLAPGEPLFEYWGHEACWLPMSLYPVFEFRRREFRVHPWWGDVLGEHPRTARDLLRRIEAEGPLRSLDLEGAGGQGWWDLKLARRVAEALWSAGDLAVRERRNFQRSFDLVERVIPAAHRDAPVDDETALDHLLLLAIGAHGWASTGTLAATWRLRNMRDSIAASLARLAEDGAIVPCTLDGGERRATGRAIGGTTGWIRPADLDLAEALSALRPRRDRGVLLSPFDPVLWDRARVAALFGFTQVLEIYKPPAERQFGYYCLPVLAGEHLVARVDLKADRGAGRLRVLGCHHEHPDRAGRPAPRDARAVASALARYAEAVGLALESG